MKVRRDQSSVFYYKPASVPPRPKLEDLPSGSAFKVTDYRPHFRRKHGPGGVFGVNVFSRQRTTDNIEIGLAEVVLARPEWGRDMGFRVRNCGEAKIAGYHPHYYNSRATTGWFELIHVEVQYGDIQSNNWHLRRRGASFRYTPCENEASTQQLLEMLDTGSMPRVPLASRGWAHAHDMGGHRYEGISDEVWPYIQAQAGAARSIALKSQIQKISAKLPMKIQCEIRDFFAAELLKGIDYCTASGVMLWITSNNRSYEGILSDWFQRFGRSPQQYLQSAALQLAEYAESRKFEMHHPTRPVCFDLTPSQASLIRVLSHTVRNLAENYSNHSLPIDLSDATTADRFMERYWSEMDRKMGPFNDGWFLNFPGAASV